MGPARPPPLDTHSKSKHPGPNRGPIGALLTYMFNFEDHCRRFCIFMNFAVDNFRAEI